jgi:glucose uptake protein GlcU
MVSFAGNVFSILSLKVNDLSLREPLGGFYPILAGLVGYALFPAERKPQFLIIFILSIFIVRYGTHRRKLRNFQIKGMHFFLLSIIFESLLPSVYRVTLGYIGPTYLTFFRVVGILLLSLCFFPLKKTFKTLTPNKVLYSCVSGIAYSAGAVSSLYAIRTLGVVVTMLLSLLGPSLRYLTCYFILKEKVRGEKL